MVAHLVEHTSYQNIQGGRPLVRSRRLCEEGGQRGAHRENVSFLLLLKALDNKLTVVWWLDSDFLKAMNYSRPPLGKF